MKKLILKVMLGTIILEAVFVCLFILIGSFDSVAWRSLASLGIIFLYSIPCLFYSKIYENEKYKYIFIGGAVIVCFLAFTSILSLWGVIVSSSFLGKITSSLSVVMWSLAFISWILSFVSANDLFNLFKKITTALISILTIFNIIIVWSSFPKGFLSRLYLVLIVLTVGSFVCTWILTKANKKEIVEMSEIDSASMFVSNNSFNVQNSVTPQSNIQVVSENQVQNYDSVKRGPITNFDQIPNSSSNVQSPISSGQIPNSSSNVQSPISSDQNVSNNNVGSNNTLL